jgi:hypothetical protein
MAKYSKKEFAELCGIKTKELSVYSKRGKVIVVNNEIDDADQNNILFMQRQLAKKQKAPSVKNVSNDQKPVDSAAAEEARNTLLEINRSKGQLELLQKQNLIDLQRIEILKKRGELVPVPAINSLIILQAESIKTAYLEASDNLLVIIAQKKQMSAEEIASARKEFTKIVNKAIDSAVDLSKTMLFGIVKDYQKKRGVGQHD